MLKFFTVTMVLPTPMDLGRMDQAESGWTVWPAQDLKSRFLTVTTTPGAHMTAATTKMLDSTATIIVTFFI